MTEEYVRTQIIEQTPRVHLVRDESADQDIATIEEWVYLTERCLAFAQTSDWGTHIIPRESISDLIRRISKDRACLLWTPSVHKDAHGFDRTIEVGWQNKHYGFLGLTPGYLVLLMLPNLPSLFASLCGQTIALVERQLFIA